MNDHHNVLLVGDVYSDSDFLRQAAIKAIEESCTAIIVTGNFGYKTTSPFLEEVKSIINVSLLEIYFLHGTHDEFDDLVEYVTEVKPVETPIKGLWYVPSGAKWTWANHKLGALGGAFSPPENQESEHYKQSMLPFSKVLKLARPWIARRYVDILITHEIPRRSEPYKTKDLGLVRSKIRRGIALTKPSLVVHGSWDMQRVQAFQTGASNRSVLTGLASSKSPEGNMAVLDVFNMNLTFL